MCRRILSITTGSVIKDIILIFPPHFAHSSGSSFQTLAIIFAQRIRLDLLYSLSSDLEKPVAGGFSSFSSCVVLRLPEAAE